MDSLNGDSYDKKNPEDSLTKENRFFFWFLKSNADGSCLRKFLLKF